MKIDIYSHISTEKYRRAFSKHTPPSAARKIDELIWDLETRFRIMDRYDDYTQVIAITGTPIETAAKGKDAVELAKLANDEAAELVVKYPDRFLCAVANLPLDDTDSALKELDRAINQLGLKGILIHTPLYFLSEGTRPPAGGKPLDSPELLPIYEAMARYNLPIWVHPNPLCDFRTPDYTSETEAKYLGWQVFGWVYQDTLAMVRLVFSGILERYPNLKFIIHHAGAMVPYFEKRIAVGYKSVELIFSQHFKQKLIKSPREYFRMFYGDTAIGGSTPGLMCAYAFFGFEHLLFGTDMPWDNELGNEAIRETIRSVEEMDIPPEDKYAIFEGNAKSLLLLS